MKIALLFGMIAGLLCAADPIVGTWKLNLAKSKYNPGPPPNAVTLTYEETADGTLKMREILDVGGTITRPQYDAKFDQKEYPILGSETYDTISQRRINVNTVETTLRKSGKVTNTSLREVSDDRKLMTLTSNGTGPKGQKMKNVEIYERQ